MKWSIREFKRASVRNLKLNYVATVFITFVIAFLTTEGANSVVLIKQYDAKAQQASHAVNYAKRITDIEFFRTFMQDVLNRHEPNSDSTDEVIRDLKALSASTAIESISAFAPETSMVVNFYSAGKEIVDKGNLLKALGIMVSGLITALVTVFLGNLLIVGKRRFYLDASTGQLDDSGRLEKTKHSAFSLLWVFRKGEYANCTKIMFLKDMYQLLWAFTIVGGFIKMYEYRMISYILADNPDISAKEAFALSKKLSDGYKWKMFILDLEFLPWQAVQVLTFGIGGLLFINPYYYGTQVQCYNYLLANAQEAACLVSDGESVGLVGSVRQTISERAKLILAKYSPFREYDFTTIVLLFLTFAIAGWLWEVVLHIAQTGDFVKRGMLNGPWLPIYGVGGVMSVVFLKKYISNPIKTLGIMVVMFGILEYLTSYVLELIHGIRWWDYTGYFMNLNGRICLEGVLIFTFAGAAVVYFLAPFFASIYDKINKTIKIVVCVVLMTLFVIDAVYSAFDPNMGKGITANWEEATQDVSDGEIDNGGFENEG